MESESAEEPLEWPADWPPSDPWKRFFIGIRWLGPDLSFFRAFRLRQSKRSAKLMAAWGREPERRKLAEGFGTLLSKALAWRTNIFLPADRFSVIAYGPRYQTMDDDLGVEKAARKLEKFCGRKLQPTFWQWAISQQFGAVIDRLLNDGFRWPGG